MEYKIEEDSPVRKTVLVTVGPEEVDAALAGTVALYKDSAQLDGFRKGKAPASVIENKFHDQIYKEARENLLNVHINDILTKMGVTPVSGITISEEDIKLEKGKGFSYTLKFEVMPSFDLPPYEGMKVEEEKTLPDEKEIEMVLERMRNENAELVSTQDKGPAKDGQIAVLDFETFVDGKPVKDFRSENFNLILGSSQALPEFEKMVKGIPAGHTAEEIIKIPDDFIAEELAGKDVTFKVTVHDIKERVVPQLNDEFAKKIGFNSLAELKDIVKASYLKNIKDMNKGIAQRKLLDQLLKQSNFELPSSMVEDEMRFLLANQSERLERQGKSLKSLGKSVEELRERLKPEAERMARDKVMLLSIAKKENLEVTPEEVEKNVYKNCVIHGEDYQEVMKNLEKSGLMFHLRDQMLCDKAMDLVYDRAEISMVEPSTEAKVDNAEAGAQQQTDSAQASASDK